MLDDRDFSKLIDHPGASEYLRDSAPVETRAEKPGYSYTVQLPRQPKTQSLLKSLEFLADVMRTLTEKEEGYGAIDKKKCVQIYAPECTPLERVHTRIDEKLSRMAELGPVTESEDTERDLVGYIALRRALLR